MKTKDYNLDEINLNHLMSEKYEKTCKHLNYLEQLYILVSTVTICITIATFS